MSKVRLLPVDETIFIAISRWCGWHSKTPTEAIDTLFSVEDSSKRDDLMRAYYYILQKKYQIANDEPGHIFKVSGKAVK